MSIDRWMGKENVVHIYNGILLNHKKEWNNAFCSNMDAPRDDHTKWSKPDRERQTPYYILYNIRLYIILRLETKKMIQMKLYTKQK